MITNNKYKYIGATSNCQRYSEIQSALDYWKLQGSDAATHLF